VREELGGKRVLYLNICIIIAVIITRGHLFYIYLNNYDTDSNYYHYLIVHFLCKYYYLLFIIIIFLFSDFVSFGRGESLFYFYFKRWFRDKVGLG